MAKFSLRVLYTCLLVTTACGFASAQARSGSSVIVIDPSFTQLVSPDAKVEPVVTDYFGRLEGPIWVRDGNAGYLLFSDIGGNLIYKWQPTCAKYPCAPTEGKLSPFLKNAGFTGKDMSDVGFLVYNDRLWVLLGGSVGLAEDQQGRILIDASGDRAVERLEKDGTRTTIADHYQGKRLSCPNDIIVKSDGTIYFTDGPAACLRGFANDPAREIPYPGLYMVKDGVLTLLDKDNPGINGLAFSPDEKLLYVTGERRKLLKYDVQPDDTVTNRRLFFDEMTDPASALAIAASTPTGPPVPGRPTGLNPGSPDGVRVDEKGNMWTGGPGGIWVISPEGKHLGTILAPDDPDGNTFISLAFGDDGNTLYITGTKNFWRIRLKACGRSSYPWTCTAK